MPYGEYLALKLVPLEPLGADAARAGRRLTSWPWAGAPEFAIRSAVLAWSGGQICYEIIFSGQVVDPKQPSGLHFQPI